MKRPFLRLAGALTLALLLGGDALAQRSCAAMDVLDQQIASDPQRALRLQQIEQFTQQYAVQSPDGSARAVVTIPVVFHVVYRTAAENISDAQIQAQVAQLNADFARLNSDAGNTPSAFTGVAANTQIQFCLAQRDPNGNATNGIVRKSTTVTSWSTNDAVKYTAQGGDNAWPASSYLNIWSCNLGSGLLGYAQFPGGTAATDGVVLLYSSIGSLSAPGTSAPYNYGRTATHEVGHWLNLRHIWGDATCGSDLVNDTPTHNTANYGCPTYPHLSTCSGAPVEMTMNYMDYTDDGCMNMFSAGQSTRMNALFATGGARVGLTTSLGCTPPTPGSCGTPTGLAASGITTSGATLSWAGVSGATSYNLQYKLSTATTWTTLNTASTSAALTGLAAGTAYNAQVQAVCSGGSSTYASPITFTTTSTSTGCTDTYESNNSSGTAKTIAVNTNIQALIGTSTDVDWFKFTNTSAAPKIKVTLTNLPFDYDMRLYRGTSTLLGTSQNGGTTSEQLISNTTTVTTYYVRVYGYGGAFSTTQCYTLRASTQSANWREMGVPEEVIEPAGGLLNLFPNPAADKVTAEYMAGAEGIVNIDVVDLTGRVVVQRQQTVAAGPNLFGVGLNGMPSGMYLLRITEGDQQSLLRFMVQQ
ncbi:MAG: T9SS type A sorting domain-containing protein [Flavobacteriales bacterium]|nr:T9SS type A sorting domain-containing protein [Flavobacteriales bacterium]